MFCFQGERKKSDLSWTVTCNSQAVTFPRRRNNKVQAVSDRSSLSEDIIPNILYSFFFRTIGKKERKKQGQQRLSENSLAHATYCFMNFMCHTQIHKIDMAIRIKNEEDRQITPSCLLSGMVYIGAVKNNEV